MVWKTKKTSNKKRNPIKVRKEIIKKVKKIIDKPYNHGTMTNAGFWGMIRAALRQKSRWWLPVSECKKLAKRKNQSSNRRIKFEYQCNICNDWFPEKLTSVDHIEEAGQLNKPDDLPGFVTRLFCEVDG